MADEHWSVRERRANQEHWEVVGAAYDEGWEKPAKRFLSRRELDFVVGHLGDDEPATALDVGVGNGRVLATVLAATRTTRLYGVDVADAMLEVCRARFAEEPRVEALSRCDVSRDPLPFTGPFAFISAVRVLKYSRDWPEVLARLATHLEQGGVLVFSMPNRRSLSRFSRPYAVPWFTTSRRDAEAACRALGLAVVDVRGMAKLPYRAYDLGEGPVVTRMVVGAERLLERLLGSRCLARELFLAVRSGTGAAPAR